ncbi:MAG: hypothetical protein IKA80_01920 [Spirochaetaceae bacterium]|nr:hypothetical protein [Spirochaetaceae bacterium]
MNASPTQQRKAKNIIWTAAENYQVEPQFLSFDHQGQANFFLNLVIGLVHKWLDWEKLEAFFGCFEGTVLESTYDGLLWLALEQVVYEKELPQRPVLEELRREHSHNMMNMAAWLVENNRLVQYQVAWCQVNLGKKPFLMPWDRRMLEELRFKGDWDTDRIIQEFRRIVRQYFKVNLTAVQKTSGKRKHSLLQMVFRKRRRVPARMFRTKDVLDDDEARKSGSAGSSWTGGSRRIDEETWEVLEKRYGPQVFAKEEVLRLEKELCTEVHRNCHLYFAGAKGDEERYQLNRQHYQTNRTSYDNTIIRLRDQLKNYLTVMVPLDKVRSSSGKLNCRKVWRCQYLNDNRIFYKVTEQPEPVFSVDILMDASRSQSGRQEVLAAQGYIIAESLTQCGVPVQVHSFNSFRSHTVLHRLRSYNQRNNDSIFGFQSEGWNRDGLAIRLVGRMMESAPHEKRLLVVLTDADPNDECAISLYQEYSGLEGIQDVTEEVQALKRKGIRVVAVFMGLDYNLQAARSIYEDNFVRITHPTQLAEAVGAIIRRQLRDW